MTKIEKKYFLVINFVTNQTKLKVKTTNDNFFKIPV